MLRNTISKGSVTGSADISVNAGSSIAALFGFIDRNISGFSIFYKAYGDSDKENRISDGLVIYFTRCLQQDYQGFVPYHFSKNPTQATSAKETDIGVRVPLNANPLATIAEFEAKRLSDTSANKEYVCGTRGGIERFKRGHHAGHLAICGMFAYVQSKTVREWANDINGWIQELANADADSTIDWKPMPEKLAQITEEEIIAKWSSVNDRKGGKPIQLYHYFINLC